MVVFVSVCVEGGEGGIGEGIYPVVHATQYIPYVHFIPRRRGAGGGGGGLSQLELLPHTSQY